MGRVRGPSSANTIVYGKIAIEDMLAIPIKETLASSDENGSIAVNFNGHIIYKDNVGAIKEVALNVSEINDTLTALNKTWSSTKIASQVQALNDAIALATGSSGSAALELTTVKANIATLDGEVNTAQSDITSLQAGVGSIGTNITALQTSITALQNKLASNDTSLDTLQELVTRIKTNETSLTTTLDNLTNTLNTTITNGLALKVDKTSVTNNLTTTVLGSPLDAVQGRLLKEALDALTLTVTSAPTITKGSVGLSLVDNTPDLAKPVSGPQQVALNTKADIIYVDRINDAIQVQLNTINNNHLAPWTETKSFTYDGKNNVIALAFMPKNTDIAFLNGRVLDEFIHYKYDAQTVTISSNLLTLGLPYKLLLKYYK